MHDNNLVDDANDRGNSLPQVAKLAENIRAFISEGLERPMTIPPLTQGQQVYKLLLTGQFKQADTNVLPKQVDQR